MNILQQIQQENLKRELTNRLNFEKAEQNSLISQVQDDVLKGMSEEEILEKARAGKYTDTPENRKLGRVGQQYGSKKEEQGGNYADSDEHRVKSGEYGAAREKGSSHEEAQKIANNHWEKVKNEYSKQKKEEGNNIEIKVGQKYHSPAPKSGGEEIDFVIKNIENNKYTIETFNKEGRKGEHTFDETTIKELINESKLKKES